MYDKFEEIVYDKNLTFYAVAKGAGRQFKEFASRADDKGCMER